MKVLIISKTTFDVFQFDNVVKVEYGNQSGTYYYTIYHNSRVDSYSSKDYKIAIV